MLNKNAVIVTPIESITSYDFNTTQQPEKTLPVVYIQGYIDKNKYKDDKDPIKLVTLRNVNITHLIKVTATINNNNSNKDMYYDSGVLYFRADISLSWNGGGKIEEYVLVVFVDYFGLYKNRTKEIDFSFYMKSSSPGLSNSSHISLPILAVSSDLTTLSGNNQTLQIHDDDDDKISKTRSNMERREFLVHVFNSSSLGCFTTSSDIRLLYGALETCDYIIDSVSCVIYKKDKNNTNYGVAECTQMLEYEKILIIKKELIKMENQDDDNNNNNNIIITNNNNNNIDYDILAIDISPNVMRIANRIISGYVGYVPYPYCVEDITHLEHAAYKQLENNETVKQDTKRSELKKARNGLVLEDVLKHRIRLDSKGFGSLSQSLPDEFVDIYNYSVDRSIKHEYRWSPLAGVLASIEGSGSILVRLAWSLLPEVYIPGRIGSSYATSMIFHSPSFLFSTSRTSRRGNGNNNNNNNAIDYDEYAMCAYCNSSGNNNISSNTISISAKCPIKSSIDFLYRGDAVPIEWVTKDMRNDDDLPRRTPIMQMAEIKRSRHSIMQETFTVEFTGSSSSCLWSGCSPAAILRSVRHCDLKVYYNSDMKDSKNTKNLDLLLTCNISKSSHEESRFEITEISEMRFVCSSVLLDDLSSAILSCKSNPNASVMASYKYSGSTMDPSTLSSLISYSTIMYNSIIDSVNATHVVRNINIETTNAQVTDSDYKHIPVYTYKPKSQKNKIKETGSEQYDSKPKDYHINRNGYSRVPSLVIICLPDKVTHMENDNGYLIWVYKGVVGMCGCNFYLYKKIDEIRSDAPMDVRSYNITDLVDITTIVK